MLLREKEHLLFRLEAQSRMKMLTKLQEEAVAVGGKDVAVPAAFQISPYPFLLINH